MHEKSRKEIRQRRLQNKKRKVEALLKLAELNDKEGRQGSHEAILEPSPKKEKLEVQEYEELRKKLKRRKQILSSQPNFLLKKAGLDATLELPANLRTPLFVRDVQSLVLFSLLGARAPIQPGRCVKILYAVIFNNLHFPIIILIFPNFGRWCKFQQWNKLAGVTLFIADGLGLKDFQKDDCNLKCFDKTLAVTSPTSYASTLHHELSVLPLNHSYQKRLDRLEKNALPANNAIDHQGHFKVMKTAFPIVSKKKETEQNAVDVPLLLRLLLTMEQLIEGAFPLPVPTGLNRNQFKDFVLTCDQYEPVSIKSPILSIDCEMCVTTSGLHELAQISVVDSNCKVVYSTLVKPHNEIKNYLTKFNGITAESLENVDVRLGDVQEKIRELVGPDTILVGHSLDSDLRAMNMFHPYIIDTSVIFNLNGDRSRKPKLKDLAKMFLDKTIQTGSHDANEDAIVAMELLQLKLEKGYRYGDACFSNVTFDRHGNAETVIVATTIFHGLENVKSYRIIGPPESTEGYRYFVPESVEFENPRKGIKSVSKAVKEVDFTLYHPSINDREEAISLLRKTWEKLPFNHLLMTLWPGGTSDEAFLGVGIKKKTMDELLQELGEELF